MALARCGLAWAGLVLILTGFAPPSARADRSYSARYATTERGQVTFVANTLETCPASASKCASTRSGAASADNSWFAMDYVDADASSATFDYSSANLALPLGATVLFAGLYWGGDTSAGFAGSEAPAASARSQVRLTTPVASPATVTATALDADASTATRYQGFADVTAQVKAGGSGTYGVGNVQSGTGANRWAGWGLTIVYRDASQPVRRLQVYDGLHAVSSSAPTADVALTDFLTPASGTVRGRLGLLAWEGDRDQTGESVTLASRTLSDALNPAADLLNSTASRDAAAVSTRSPNYANLLGVDADELSIDGALGNGASSTTLHLTTTGDTYLPAAVALATDEGAPIARGAPGVAGTARDGQALTATAGTWDGTPAIAYAYQWRRCDASGVSCADVAGATSATYALTAADAGSTMRVAVTATNAAGATTATSAQTATVAPTAPVNTLAPSISGTARDGSTLTLGRGTWTGTPTIAYAQQWRRCDAAGAHCVDIAGATATTYTPTAADVGSTLRAVVTATNGAGPTASVSIQTATVAAVAPANATAPTVSGTVRDGQTLTADRGTWTGTAPIAYAHQWRRCDSAGAGCTDVPGATATTYALAPADVGSSLRVAVTATNAAGSVLLRSAATGVVAAAAPVASAPATIAGTARDGQTLTADRGNWTGTPTIGYAYQWRRCAADGSACTEVMGATASTYDLTAADVGSALRVVVTATNAGGSVTSTSTVSAAVAPTAPASTAAPSISGSARDGATLTLDRGSFSGTPTIAYTQQWRRCDAEGNACADIAGATSTTYTAAAADVGATIRAVVTATNAAGATSAASAASAPVAPAPPASVVAPAISGAARDGQTLSADRGTWEGTPTLAYAYQWRRCDVTGAACADIDGATTSAYTASGADIGRRLRVAVAASNAAGNATASSPATATVTATAPTATNAPAQSGTARDGQTLTAAGDGAWAGTTPIAYARQWMRCDPSGAACSAIRGATATAYALTPDDVGASLRLRVIASNAGGTAAADSAPSSVVAPAPPVNVVAPSIDGTAQQGQTVTADPGTWSGTPTVTYTYQWLRCDLSGNGCAEIAGATTRSYALAVADVGGRVRVRVTATNAADSAAATSAAGQVDPAGPAATTDPSVSGTARDGQTLTATDGTWSGTPPLSFSRRWLRCDASGASCASIAGATASTYAAVADDVGRTLRVAVTATNAAGAREETSAASAIVVGNSPANTAPPTVAGTARDDATLTVDAGTWSGTAPLSYVFGWRRCNPAGGACVAIPGATQATYPVTAADVGATLRGTVKAVNATGSSLVVQSAQTARVVAAAPASTSAPAIAGVARDGATLSAESGGWSATQPVTYAYRWQRCDAAGASCQDIAGTTSSTYVQGPDDVGSTVRVVVTAANAGGSASAASVPTAVVAPLAPIATTAPSIAGDARDGATLTGAVGAWDGTPALHYDHQWRRCDADGNGCADIAGATDASYDAAPADVGHALRLVVTATNAAGATGAASTATAAVAPAAPSSATAPSLSGAARDGATLTATAGDWAGTPPLRFAYQWRRCATDGSGCTDVAGSTDATYALTPDDVDHAMRVVVTATNDGGSATRSSDASAPIDAAAPALVGEPSISGAERDGSRVTSDRGTWSGTPTIAYAYQWQRCDAAGADCHDLAGARGGARTLTSDDVGHTLRLRVTATNAVASASATSAPTGPVAAVGAVSTTPPDVSGTARDGATLTADPGQWSGTVPIDVTYAWQRCAADGTDCADIPGATDPGYELTPADVDRTIRMRVTASNAAGSATAASAPTATIVAAAPALQAPPAIGGSARRGETLTAGHGTWSGTPTLAYAYQWQRCAADGSPCDDVPGATGAAYPLDDVDVDHALRVVVTATNAAGSTQARSAATSRITAAPSVAAPPTLTGAALDARTLSADRGTWRGAQPIDFAYRWQRCAADGRGCTDIARADGPTYQLTANDVDHTVRVVVTATNPDGAAEEASAPAGPVAARAPVSTRAPNVSGTARQGEPLTADRGDWSATEPIAYAYRWQRCAADGSACADIAGTGDASFAPGADDVGHALRVIVRATNAAGSQDAASTATSAVQAPDAAPQPPAPTPSSPPAPSSPDTSTAAPTSTDATPAPSPATGSGGAPTDLATLPGTLVAERACQQLTGGAGPYRARVAGVGAVLVRVQADAVVAPDTPIRVTVTAPRGRRVRATVMLDRRRVRLSGRAPLTGAIAPALLGTAGTHVLRVRLAAAGGPARTVTARLRTAACAIRLSTRGRVAAGGRGALLLRVDSRTAMARVAVTVPAPAALRGGPSARAAGRLRLVSAGAGPRVLRLTLPARRRTGVLLDAKAGPRVAFGPSGFVVTGLPAGTGIVELTIDEPRAIAARGLRVGARVSAIAGGSSALSVRTRGRPR